MDENLHLQVRGSSESITFQPGATTFVVGANGVGKTQLAIECERQLGERAHRVSAQRLLAIDTSVARVGEEAARSALRYGYPDTAQYGGPVRARSYGRWSNDSPKAILDDSDALLQVLFAEQSNTAVKAYNKRSDGFPVDHKETLIRQLRVLFHSVMPSRDLQITADDITVVPVGEDEGLETFPAARMSDGEKAVFYMIGQVLVADVDSVFIVDEPEVHVHRSILGRLWDALEAARPDCSFLVITHDLEFAASRPGAKYVISRFSPATGWVIKSVPEAEGFSEHDITLILGSRKPILFVEGQAGSLDLAFYRACYPEWTIVPRGGCESVIHAVNTFHNNSELTRINCLGLIDADDRSVSELDQLRSSGIYALPVAEIENLLLLPQVSEAILRMDSHEDGDIPGLLEKVAQSVFDDASVSANIEQVVVQYVRRRVDRMLKIIDLSNSRSAEDLALEFSEKVAGVDIEAMSIAYRESIIAAVEARDLPSLLALWDRKKPLMAIASRELRGVRLSEFSNWVVRAIRSPADDRLRLAISGVLPVLSVV
jgi:hypothetical protein